MNTEAGTSKAEDPPTDAPDNLPRRSGRIIHPTWKVVQSRLEPPVVHIQTLPNPERRVTRPVRQSFHGTRNSFGLSRTGSPYEKSITLTLILYISVK